MAKLKALVGRIEPVGCSLGISVVNYFITIIVTINAFQNLEYYRNFSAIDIDDSNHKHQKYNLPHFFDQKFKTQYYDVEIETVSEVDFFSRDSSSGFS